MSKKSDSVIITITVTITIFVALAAFFLRPSGTADKYSSEIFEEAKNRQSIQPQVVTEKLETDITVLSDEDKMAQKVSEKLIDDEAFVSEVSQKGEAYISSRLDSFESELTKKIEEKAGENALDYDSFVQSLLNDDAFISSLTEALKERLPEEKDAETLSRSIVETETFKEALREYLMSVAEGSFPLPEFGEGNASLTGDGYKDVRNAERDAEIDKILEYLGY